MSQRFTELFGWAASSTDTRTFKMSQEQMHRMCGTWRRALCCFATFKKSCFESFEAWHDTVGPVGLILDSFVMLTMLTHRWGYLGRMEVTRLRQRCVLLCKRPGAASWILRHCGLRFSFILFAFPLVKFVNLVSYEKRRMRWTDAREPCQTRKIHYVFNNSTLGLGRHGSHHTLCEALWTSARPMSPRSYSATNSCYIYICNRHHGKRLDTYERWWKMKDGCKEIVPYSSSQLQEKLVWPLCCSDYLKAYAWQPGAGRETAWSQCRTTKSRRTTPQRVVKIP